VADAREAFQRGTISQAERDRTIALAGLKPKVQHVLGDFPDHFLAPEYGGTPLGALESVIAHGHGDLLNDPMSSEASLFRRYASALYGPKAMVEAQEVPFFGGDDERTAKLRAILAGRPYGAAPAAPAQPGKVAFAVPPVPRIAPIQVPGPGAPLQPGQRVPQPNVMSDWVNSVLGAALQPW
jgi:hypothetical protein